MSTFLYFVIGFVANRTLESCDIKVNQWQYWVIVACIVASVLVTYFLIERR